MVQCGQGGGGGGGGVHVRVCARGRWWGDVGKVVVVVRIHIRMRTRGEGPGPKTLKPSYYGSALGGSGLWVGDGGFCGVTGPHAMVT